jgi:hypothetical protein
MGADLGKAVAHALGDFGLGRDRIAGKKAAARGDRAFGASDVAVEEMLPGEYG